MKVPGTNKRIPRKRAADEVITMDRPDLRIIDQETWDESQARLKAVHRKYTQGSKTERIISPKRSSYLLSGILVCDECGAPMSILAGSSATYYRCSTNRTKGTCANNVSLREDVLRRGVLRSLRERLQSQDGIAYVRKRIAEELRDYSRNLEAEIKTHRERIERTENRIKGLVDFIADGDRSEAVVSGLRDLEAQAMSERHRLALTNPTSCNGSRGSRRTRRLRPRSRVALRAAFCAQATRSPRNANWWSRCRSAA